MKNFYAVVPDGQSDPVALFAALEDAIEWGMEKFGSDHFRIKSFLPPKKVRQPKKPVVDAAPPTFGPPRGNVPIN